MNLQKMFKNNRIIKNLAAFENFESKHKSYGLSYPETKTFLVIDPINSDKPLYTKFMQENDLENIKYIKLDPDSYQDLKTINSIQGMTFKEYESLGLCHFSINGINIGRETQNNILSITDSNSPSDKTPALFIGEMLNFNQLLQGNQQDKKEAIRKFIENLELFRGFQGFTPVFDSNTSECKYKLFHTLLKIFPGNSFLKGKIEKKDYTLNFLAEYKEVYPFFDLEKKKFAHLIGDEDYSKLKLAHLFLNLYEASVES